MLELDHWQNCTGSNGVHAARPPGYGTEVTEESKMNSRATRPLLIRALSAAAIVALALHFNSAMTHPAELLCLHRVSAVSLSNCETQFTHLIL